MDREHLVAIAVTATNHTANHCDVDYREEEEEEEDG